MLHASCRKVLTRAAEWRGQKAGVMDVLFDIDLTRCEIHFLTDCTLYMQDRNLLYKICQKYIYHFNYLNNDGKFTEIMKSKEKNVIRALGKFVYNSMLQRSNLDPNSHKKKKKRKVRQKAN